MEVRIWDVRSSIEGNHEGTELVATLDIKMYKDLDFGGFIVIDGKSYRHCMYDNVKDVLCVKPIKLNEKAKEIAYSSNFECPYCGSVNHDAWELDDEGETCCGSCGSELEYEKVVTVEYNIKPKKCAPVTRV